MLHEADKIGINELIQSGLKLLEQIVSFQGS